MVDSLAILVLLLSFERVTSRMDLSDSNGWVTYILAWFEGLSRISEGFVHDTQIFGFLYIFLRNYEVE